MAAPGKDLGLVDGRPGRTHIRPLGSRRALPHSLGPVGRLGGLQAAKLARMLEDNFTKFADQVPEEVKAAEPR